MRKSIVWIPSALGFAWSAFATFGALTRRAECELKFVAGDSPHAVGFRNAMSKADPNHIYLRRIQRYRELTSAASSSSSATFPNSEPHHEIKDTPSVPTSILSDSAPTLSSIDTPSSSSSSSTPPRHRASLDRTHATSSSAPASVYQRPPLPSRKQANPDPSEEQFSNQHGGLGQQEEWERRLAAKRAEREHKRRDRKQRAQERHREDDTIGNIATSSGTTQIGGSAPPTRKNEFGDDVVE